MKKHIMKPLFFVVLISVLSFACCEEECDDPTDRMCPNFDVCLVTPKADASFVMLDSIFVHNSADTSIAFIIDTINSWTNVFFKALGKNMESYEWKVGTDPTVFTDREFELGFDQFQGLVNVRLITTAKDVHGCLNEQERVDTSFQEFEVVQIGAYSSPIFGSYTGYNLSQPDEEYSITVLGEGEDLWHSFRLFGLPIPCDNPIGIWLDYGYDWFVSVHDDIHCRNTIVIGRLQEDRKTLEVEYFYDADDGTRIREVFVGTRL